MKTSKPPEKVRCSINRKWFVDDFGNPADRGRPVLCWCEDHAKPVALFSPEEERIHDERYH